MKPYIYLRGLRHVDLSVFCVESGQKSYWDPVFNVRVPFSSGQQVKRSILDTINSELQVDPSSVTFVFDVNNKGALGEGEVLSLCDPQYYDQLLGGWMRAAKGGKERTLKRRMIPKGCWTCTERTIKNTGDMTGEEIFGNLHEVLRNLYDEMMPLCSDITGVATGVAALGALFYVASRVWQALSRAEPIDIYPLFRPFCLGACIMFFPTFVLGTINGIMSPVVTGCHGIMEGQTLSIQEYSEKRQKLEYEAMKRNPETAYLVDNEEYERQIEDLGWSPSDLKAMAGMAMERIKYQAKQSMSNFFRSFLELLFQSVSLILDTLRTFFLIVLSILGPLSFAISVYDGFHYTMIQWICQYVSIYLWLPISDLFSSVLARIQVLMIEKDIAALSDPTYVPDVSNSAYIIFMLIAIVGYFTIPTVSTWVIQASGAGNYGKQVNSWSMKGGRAAAAVTGASVGHVAGKLRGK